MRKIVLFSLLAMLTLALTWTPAARSYAGQTAMLPRTGMLLRPVAVMIDNHSDARPQSGFDQAALVYEALAEGGITRFMFVYNGDNALPDTIGPVRSTRRYYAEWAAGLAAVHVHAGGSPEGLAIAQGNPRLVNVDGLLHGTWSTFYRSTHNVIPHNLYTSGAQLRAYAPVQTASPLTTRQPDGSLASTFPGAGKIGYLYRQPIPIEQRGAGQHISYTFLTRWTGASWDYDATQNSYVRSVDGAVQHDGTTHNPIVTTNLVVLEAASELIAGDEKGRIELGSIGTGRAKIFHEGHEYDVTWHKESADSMLRFFYLDGVTEVPFVAGNTWIAVVPWLENVRVR